MKKHLFLDLGNVLLTVKKDAALAKIASILNRQKDEVEKAIDWKLEKAYETGRISTDQYIQHLNKETQVFDFENLCAVWKHGFSPITSTIELLPELSQKNHLYLLSNTNKIHFTAIQETFDIFKDFEHLFLSYEMGYRKPDPEIYKKALNTVDISPEQAYFVDDLQENIDTAAGLGITTHQYKNARSFQQFLNSHTLI